MIKVIVSGYKEPFSIVGEYLREDEKYIYLIDNGVKKRVPHFRVVAIEDFSDLEVEKVLPSPVLPEKPHEQTKEDVKRAIMQRIAVSNPLQPAQAESPPPPPLTLSDEKIDVVITVSGAFEDSLVMKIKESNLVGNQFTHHLSTEIAMNPEIQAIMGRGLMFDGLPTVSGRNINIKTKKIKETLSNAGEVFARAGIMSKVLQNPLFKKPEREYPSTFPSSIGLGAASSTSPFDGPIELEEPEDVHHSLEADGDQEEAH